MLCFARLQYFKLNRRKNLVFCLNNTFGSIEEYIARQEEIFKSLDE